MPSRDPVITLPVRRPFLVSVTSTLIPYGSPALGGDGEVPADSRLEALAQSSRTSLTQRPSSFFADPSTPWRGGFSPGGDDEAFSPGVDGGALTAEEPDLAWEIERGRYRLAWATLFGITAASPGAFSHAGLNYN